MLLELNKINLKSLSFLIVKTIIYDIILSMVEGVDIDVWEDTLY